VQTKALVSIAECARALGVSERTVRRLVSQRRVPAYKVGGQWRLDVDEVKACLRSAVSTPSGSGDDAPLPPLIV
jgi:excisionase family DNA binding protein